MFCVWRSGRPSRGQFSLSLMWDPGLEITSSVPCGKRFTCSAIPAPNTVWIPCVQQKEKGKKASNVACILFVFIVFENIFTCLYIKSEKKKACYQQNSRTFKPTFGAPVGTRCVAVQCITKRGKGERRRGRGRKQKHRGVLFFFPVEAEGMQSGLLGDCIHGTFLCNFSVNWFSDHTPS